MRSLLFATSFVQYVSYLLSLSLCLIICIIICIYTKKTIIKFFFVYIYFTLFLIYFTFLEIKM